MLLENSYWAHVAALAAKLALFATQTHSIWKPEFVADPKIVAWHAWQLGDVHRDQECLVDFI